MWSGSQALGYITAEKTPWSQILCLKCIEKQQGTTSTTETGTKVSINYYSMMVTLSL